MLLLDTNVVSALRKPERHPEVAAWVESVEGERIYLSVITVMEIERGVRRQRSTDSRYATKLRRWLSSIIAEHAERILPITIPIAARWGRLSHRLGHGELDLAIAATALEHGLTVATRNVAHFAPSGVAVVNPFEG